MATVNSILKSFNRTINRLKKYSEVEEGRRAVHAENAANSAIEARTCATESIRAQAIAEKLSAIIDPGV